MRAVTDTVESPRRWCMDYGSVYCAQDVRCSLCQRFDGLLAEVESLRAKLDEATASAGQWESLYSHYFDRYEAADARLRACAAAIAGKPKE